MSQAKKDEAGGPMKGTPTDKGEAASAKIGDGDHSAKDRAVPTPANIITDAPNPNNPAERRPGDPIPGAGGPSGTRFGDRPKSMDDEMGDLDTGDRHRRQLRDQIDRQSEFESVCEMIARGVKKFTDAGMSGANASELAFKVYTHQPR